MFGDSGYGVEVRLLFAKEKFRSFISSIMRSRKIPINVYQKRLS
jgi:hypothetical protein